MKKNFVSLILITLSFFLVSLITVSAVSADASTWPPGCGEEETKRLEIAEKGCKEKQASKKETKSGNNILIEDGAMVNFDKNGAAITVVVPSGSNSSSIYECSDGKLANMPACGCKFNDSCSPGTYCVTGTSNSSSGKCDKAAVKGDTCQCGEVKCLNMTVVRIDGEDTCVATLIGEKNAQALCDEGSCPCDSQCNAAGYCRVAQDINYFCSNDLYKNSAKTIDGLSKEWNKAVKSGDYSGIEDLMSCVFQCVGPSANRRHCTVTDEGGRKATFNGPPQNCVSGENCSGGGVCGELDSSGTSSSNSSSSVSCKTTCSDNSSVEECTKKGISFSYKNSLCKNGCDAKTGFCNGEAIVNLDCSYTCENGVSTKTCSYDEVKKQEITKTCSANDCKDCYASGSSSSNNTSNSNNSTSSTGSGSSSSASCSDDQDCSNNQNCVDGQCVNNSGNGGGSAESGNGTSGLSGNAGSGSSSSGGSSSSISTNSFDVGSSVDSKAVQTVVQLTGNNSNGQDTSGKFSGKSVSQTLTLNASSKIVVLKNNGGLAVAQEGDQDWEFSGGEDNSPLAFWVDSEKSYDVLKNNPNNYFKSRILYYTMICESLECEVINKPSYINILDVRQDGKECFYDLEFSADAPIGEEFNLEFNKQAKCQFEVRDEKNQESVTSKVTQTPENQIYDFRVVYTGEVAAENLVANISNSSFHQPSTQVSVSSLNLQSLSVKNYQLSPAFNPNYNYYSVELDQIISEADILAEPEDPLANIEIELFKDVMGSQNSDRTAYVVVISPDGKRKKTYSILFNLKRNKAFLLDLSSSLGPMMPEFNKYSNNYQVDLSSQKSLFGQINNQTVMLNSLTAIPEDTSNLVSFLPLEFEVDRSFSVLVEVKSPDGLKIGNYYVTFYGDERMWHY